MRRIDVVAVGLLRRTDHLIHGFEIKVTRADLRQELREPEKARTGALYCDRWWLALADIALLRDTDKLPDDWGVIAAWGRGLRVHTEPKPIQRVESPEFRAALLHAGARSPSYRYAMGFQAGLIRGQKHNQSVIDDAYRRGSSAGYMAGLHEGREKATA
jgi:hypothetical protein